MRTNTKHASERTFVNGKEEIRHLYDVGRSLQNEFNPRRRHDSFYEFQTASTRDETRSYDAMSKFTYSTHNSVL